MQTGARKTLEQHYAFGQESVICGGARVDQQAVFFSRFTVASLCVCTVLYLAEPDSYVHRNSEGNGSVRAERRRWLYG